MAHTAGAEPSIRCYRCYPDFLLIAHRWRKRQMCRNIKMLFNFDPPVTEEEIRAASLQYVRKVSGLNKPSKANEAAFLAAVEDIAAVSARLLSSLETNAPKRNREEEAAKAKARSAERFGNQGRVRSEEH